MSVLGTLIRPARRLSPGLDTRLTWRRYSRTPAAAGMRLIDAIVGRGDVVIDIGAADALYAARLSQLVGRTGVVHAFEPNPAQFPRLRALSERRANVTAYQLALSDSSGEAELHVPVLDSSDRPGLGSLAVPTARSAVEHQLVPITVDRLDHVIAAGSPPATFLKCDVEGHEFAVLRGAEQTLRRSHPAILVEIEQRHQDEPISRTFDFLADLGYEGYALGDDGAMPVRKFDVERDQLAYLGPEFRETVPPGYVNDFLFVARGADVAELLEAARPVG